MIQALLLRHGRTSFSLSIYSHSPADEPRQGTLFTIGVALFAVLFNIFAAKQLPIFEWLVLVFHVVGFFVMMVPLWALAPKVSTHEIFLEFENYGGW